MASVQTIDCEECGGKSIVKVPTDYQDDYKVSCCPLCGSPVEVEDFGDDE